MKVAVALLAVVALAHGAAILPATHFVHTPQYDSAIIKSDRLGGNFAYSTVEAQAYAAVQPVVQNVITPVGESYHVTPVHQYPAFVPAYQPAYQPAYAPVFADPAVQIHPVAPVFYPGVAPAAPAAPVASYPQAEVPAAPAAPAAPVASYPQAEVPAAPQAPQADDSVDSAASNDDSVSVEAA